MSGSSAERVIGQVHRLFNSGVLGTLTDAQLLDRFVARRDEPKEAAFEELVLRHGPLVFSVCRNVLHDVQDAEDAFQTVFLVLAHRASSIRRRASVAGWLYGVARRVANRARSRAVHRRLVEQRKAERFAEQYIPPEIDPDWHILHEEINRLPERLRAPLVLCYLEGQTYGAAAQHLELSEGKLRGRLSQARKRLRRRLTLRDVTIPAGLLAAGVSTQAQVALPGALICSTIRISLGFTSDAAAMTLARGVMNSMLLNQLKIAAFLVLVGLGSSYCLWQALGAQAEKKPVGQATSKPSDDLPKPQSKAPTTVARLTGVVKLEGTGQPIAGAKLQISVGFVMGAGSKSEKVVESGADGRFTVDLPAGNTRVFLSDPPAGYLVLSARDAIEDVAVRPDQPEIRREYRVRKGAIWNFQFTRGSNRTPSTGFVTVLPPATWSRAYADDRGDARLTLPTEGFAAELGIRESDPQTTAELQTGLLRLKLDWEPGFRPEELEELSRLEGNDRRFRLIDSDAKTATVQAPDGIEPVKENGKLVLRVSFLHRDAKDFAALTGQVLDEEGQPIAGARVGLWPPGRAPRDQDSLRYTATTDPQGRYRLRDIPRLGIDGKPLELRLTVTKEGYAGVQSPRLTLTDGDIEKPKVVDPIRLERGVSFRGIVVDHRGQPVAGASVQSKQPNLEAGASGPPQTTLTDANGRFLMSGLHRGITGVFAFHEKVRDFGVFLADGSTDEVRFKLPEQMDDPGANIGALRAPPAEPLAIGQLAPEWQVGPWSDRPARKLADDRGKVVVIYFWGLMYWPSVSSLPALGKLVAEFQPRGVEFRAIHNAEPNEQRALEQARKALAFKSVSLATAVDQSRIPRHPRGETAQRYGGQAFPLPIIIVIDRAGKIAYRSDTATGVRNLGSVARRIAEDPASMSELKMNELVERTLAAELEKALK
jgi:RNA polymerase sigma factor (sigma-70 family)